MSATDKRAPSPIALGQEEGEALWFLGFLATIKASAEATEGRVAVTEHLAPQSAGSSFSWVRESRNNPPLHIFCKNGFRT
jgi:hypothetical protein